MADKKISTSRAVAIRIDNLLKQKNMTKYAFEKKSGIGHGSLNGIMLNKNKTVTLSMLYQIAEGFNMSVRDFLADPVFDTDNILIG